MARSTELSPTDKGLEWNDLSVILAICRAQSLSGAARKLGCTHSTVFRQINAIEKKTGVRFFDRFQHGYVMTDAGRTAQQYAERIEGEFQALDREVMGQDTALRGRIRVTCPEAFAEDIAPGIMARFCKEHPEIQIDVAPGHGAVDLNKREAEIAIRATKAAPEQSFGRKVSAFRFALYSTPGYMERHHDTPLADHSVCLIEGSANWLIPLIWASREEADSRTVFQCRASRAVINATLQSMGLTFMPCYAGDAEPGLIRVSETITPLDMQLWVLTHPDLRKTARVRALMSHLYEELGQRASLFAGETKSPDRWRILSSGQ